MKITITSKKYGVMDVFYDDADHEIMSSFKWCVASNRNTFYAMSRIKLGHKKYKTIRMHQLVLSGTTIDHIDQNGLNNTRSNLRASTNHQNGCNRGVTSRNKCGYKGVYQMRNKYVATIRKHGKLIHGGTFVTSIEAAKRYNQLAIEHHGLFANLNRI